MKFRIAMILGFATLAAMPASSPASTNVTHELEALGQATGGSHWSNIVGIVADGTESIDGFKCHVHTLVDLRNGQWKKTTHCPVFSTARGIDSEGAWRKDRSGWVHSFDSPEAKKLTITDRWLNRNGPYFPNKDAAELKRLPAKTIHNESYQRIAATPAGGRKVTLWIGSKPDLLARTVMLRSFQIDTTEYRDYRNVHGVKVPFRISSSVGADAKPDVETIARYRLLWSIPKHLLDRPSNRLTDATIPAKGVRIPFSFSLSDKLLVEAHINGKGPFPFVLDTGGHAILTPETAKALGLKTSGNSVSYGAGGGSTPVSYTRIHSISLGGALIDDQSVMVMPLSPISTNRGDKPPVAGILGLEVFERFAVTIDPVHKTLALQSFTSFKPPKKAAALPIRFTSDMPLVHATLDGKTGIFGMDTGNSGPLMIFPTWAKHNDLARYYQAGVPLQEGGEGGMFTAHMAYIHSLSIGGRKLSGKLLGLLTPHGAGATSNPSEAGNLGVSVWKAFTFSLDYRNERLYLIPRTHYTPRHPTATGGFEAVKFTPKSFTVFRITPNSPAAKAGLKKGDQIVAVDGVEAGDLASLYLMAHIDKSKPGTHLQLTLSNGHSVHIVLTANTATQQALHPRMNGQ